jgi:hypothetical protein
MFSILHFSTKLGKEKKKEKKRKKKESINKLK